MKNYLSFGGGVNSTAMYLLLMDEGIEFEAVYVDHGCDWPETREYVYEFAKQNPLTILRPWVGTREGKHFADLFEYCWFKKMLPSRVTRWCTDKFKRRVLGAYHKKPCWVFIGYAADEAHRATISTHQGQEFRWPLIEHGIDRDGCKQLIKDYGFIVPPKSGCWICPFQRVSEWKILRRQHPDLFCKAKALEERHNTRNKKPYYLRDIPLEKVVGESQQVLFKDMEYPPCECGL
jgi:3'-phosphoadenosine 5'-phosphosulfate sulfotransferase (PAPS reductase)/FAD synthetase